MCIFAINVSRVHKTRIFVAPTVDGRQLTVYENAVEATPTRNIDSEDERVTTKHNAMILPCPINEDGEEVTLIDLSGKGDNKFSFNELDECFPKLFILTKGITKGKKMAAREEALEVIEIGAYKVSVAPTIKDLKRANKGIFKISAGTRKVLKRLYEEGYGFVICMFDTTKNIEPHPIGYIHDRLPSGDLFVPCKHVHDGKTHRTEHFDHSIYSLDARDSNNRNMKSVDQLKTEYKKKAKEEHSNYEHPLYKVDKYLGKTQLAQYLSLDDDPKLYRLNIIGNYPNKDMNFSLGADNEVPAAAVVSKSKSRKEKKIDSDEEEELEED